MNGDLKQIFDEVKAITVNLATLETTQQLHHEQNQKDIGGVAGVFFLFT